MRIWQLSSDVSKFDSLVPEPPFTYEERHSFDGRCHLKSWTARRFERMEPEKRLELGDAPGFTRFILSKKALDCLQPLIMNNMEALPLLFDEGEFFLVNVTTVINGIDYEKAVYKTFRDGKKIMLFEKYAFIPSKVIGISLFKIIDEPLRFPFVSDEFKNKVEENDLKGFKFELAWECE